MSDTGCITEWGPSADWALDRGCMNDLASGRRCGFDPGPNPLPPVSTPGGTWLYGDAGTPGELNFGESEVMINRLDGSGTDHGAMLLAPANVGRTLRIAGAGGHMDVSPISSIGDNPAFVTFVGPMVLTGELQPDEPLTVTIVDTVPVCGGNVGGPALTVSPTSVAVGENRAQLGVQAPAGTWDTAQPATAHFGPTTVPFSNLWIASDSNINIPLGDTNRFIPGPTFLWIEQGAVITDCAAFEWLPWTGPVHINQPTPNVIDTTQSTPLVISITGTGFTPASTVTFSTLGATTSAYVDATHMTLTITNPSEWAFVNGQVQPLFVTDGANNSNAYPIQIGV